MEYDIKFSICFGTKCYYKKGTDILHREDGPALEYPNEYKAWYINGERHREGGPALESSKRKEWFINGQRHRIDGPAIVLASNEKEWYINGTRLSQEKELILNKWWDNKNGI